jgi:hypothetical protein
MDFFYWRVYLIANFFARSHILTRRAKMLSRQGKCCLGKENVVLARKMLSRQGKCCLGKENVVLARKMLSRQGKC